MEVLMRLAGHKAVPASSFGNLPLADSLRKLLGRDVCYAWHMSANATFAGVDYLAFGMLRMTFEGHRGIAFLKLKDCFLA
eukprot:13596476-Alexandrium_andersonii.AAC.1